MSKVTSSSKIHTIASLSDIAFMSLSSLIASWTAAQLLSVKGLGVFGVVFSIATIAQTVLQSGLGMVVLRSDGRQGGNAFFWLERVSQFVIGAGLVGLILQPFQNEISTVLLSTALCFMFARHSANRAVLTVVLAPTRAILASACVFLSASIGLILTVTNGTNSFGPVLTLYFLGFVISGLIARQPIVNWYKTSTTRAPGLLKLSLEGLLLAGGVQIAGVLVVVPLGLTFSAAVRGVALLLGPLSSLLTAVRYIAVPRLARSSSRDRLSLTSKLSATLLLFGVAWATVCWFGLNLYPDLLVGQSAPYVKVLYWPLSIGTILQCGYFAFFIGARSGMHDRVLLVTNSIYLATVASSTAAVFVTSSATWYFAGTYISQVIASLILFFHLRRDSLHSTA